MSITSGPKITILVACAAGNRAHVCVGGGRGGQGLWVCIGTPHALSRCSALSPGHLSEGGVDGTAVRAGVSHGGHEPYPEGQP